MGNRHARTRPNIIRLAGGTFRIDLRGKAFRSILQTVAGGKSTLDFRIKARADAKADEVEALLTKYGEKKMATLEMMLRIAPIELQAKPNFLHRRAKSPIKPGLSRFRRATRLGFLAARQRAAPGPVCAIARSWLSGFRS